MAKVTVRWEVEDGFVGNRPQEFEIDLEDFGGGSSEGAILDTLHASVEYEFNNQVSWYCQNEDEVVRVVQRYLKNRQP